jgi:hypothetical protein
MFFAIFFVVGNPTFAQSAGCDEGVIRMTDRSGTIQICSAIQAKLPQLQRQLQEATQAIVAQRSQISELTRLVRGMNAVSQQVGVDRQAQMLEALAREFSRALRQGDERLARSVGGMVDGVDDLQAQMLAVLGKQGGHAALGSALQGSVGDSIAKLEFGSALRQIDEIDRRLQAIEQRLGDVKSDTGQILQQVGRVESTLEQIAANFDTLRRSAAIIPKPVRPEEFYSNAVQFEARGDMLNARESYRWYFEGAGLNVDPVERYTQLMSASFGRAGAIEALRVINRQRPSALVEAYIYALEPPAIAASRLQTLLNKHRTVGPLHFLLARQYGEDRLGRQSLDDQQREREALQAFLAAHERGEVIRYFIDQRMAADWLSQAEASLKRLSGVERLVATVSISPSNAGWQLMLQANEPVRRAFYRLSPNEALVDMGKSEGIDPETREPVARTFVSLPRGIDLKTIEFSYDDLSRTRRGPVKLAEELTDPIRATATWQRDILEQTANNWVQFRGDMPILYFSHLASYRCAIRQVRWGWGNALDQVLVLSPCDPEKPFSVSHTDSFMIKFNSESIAEYKVSVEVTYFDGSKSGVRSYSAPKFVTDMLRKSVQEKNQ